MNFSVCRTTPGIHTGNELQKEGCTWPSDYKTALTGFLTVF